MSQKHHWEDIYSTKLNENLGWYKPHLTTSLTWIKGFCLEKKRPFIDVGGGVSTLVDDLLEEGHQTLTILDISEQALSITKARLDKKAEQVKWIAADITSVHLPANYYELWHDRAVFHFLTSVKQQQKYRGNLLKALKPGGHLIIGVFAPEAPPRCSGLPVQCYTSEQLERFLGDEFELIKDHKEPHITPGETEQMYLYCHFRKTA
jgi:ubiquinone/menaquinone biosynthesis C-methylase UbiE